MSNQVKPIKQPVSASVASKPKADAKQQAAISKNSNLIGLYDAVAEHCYFLSDDEAGVHRIAYSNLKHT